MNLEIVISYDWILGVKFNENLNFRDCINPLAHKLALLINIFQNVWGVRSAGPWTKLTRQRQDRCGVSPLLHDGQLHSDSRRKAEILNQQFFSVFTDEDTTNMPKFEEPPTSAMDNIEITQSGITRLLSELNADKAPWWASKFTPQKMLPRRYLCRVEQNAPGGKRPPSLSFTHLSYEIIYFWCKV